MAKINGRTIPLSIPRRMVCDTLYAGQQLALVVIERRMRLGPLVAARNAAYPKPSWCAIFTKALAAVAARRPELRRAYAAWPWPRLFEYDRNTVSVVVERDIAGEAALFLARLRSPEAMSLHEIDETIRRHKQRPIDKISGFKGALRLARLPHWVRRAFWKVVMNALPKLRGQLLGSMGVSVTASLGAAGLYTITPWTLTMFYDVFDGAGSLDVRWSFDHRVVDGIFMARALEAMERELCGPILQEILEQRAQAA